MNLKLPLKQLTYSELFDSFMACQKQFTDAAIKQQEELLSQLLTIPFNHKKITILLHEALLFSIAYPSNIKVYNLANEVMNKLVETVTQQAEKDTSAYYNSGITGSVVCAQFGLLLNRYLLDKNLSRIALSAIDGDNSDLVSRLTFTLDPVEQELMPGEAGYFAKWKKLYLRGIKDERELLQYYISASMNMSGSIAEREGIFAGFNLYTQFTLDKHLQGLSLGRQNKGSVHFHPGGIEKKMDLETAFKQGKPKRIALGLAGQQNLVILARGAMASLLRETDTFTYAQTHETELYDMGKGITIALYYMIPEQKFSLQSYIGYLLFKNGAPMAYGGCWLFFKQAAFGVNVLPPYRGGESANVVCQLLRLYHYRFNLQHFSVDPYQIGKGNDDGIASGAFWFYYKLGFRPMQQKYASLAASEQQKMALDKSYKSPSRILKILANSELYLNVTNSDAPYFSLTAIGDSLSKWISENCKGNREVALENARIKYQKTTRSRLPANSFVNNLLLTLNMLGAFEKLAPALLKKVCDTFHQKEKNEAKAFLDLQKQASYFKLFETK